MPGKNKNAKQAQLKSPNKACVPEECAFKSAKELVDAIASMKKDLEGNKKAVPDKLPEMLLALTNAVDSIVKNMNTFTPKAMERERLDEIDELRQRSMKGNLVLNTTKGSGLILSEEVLEAKNMDTMDHALDLVEKKYSVKIPKEEVQDAHHLPGGA